MRLPMTCVFLVSIAPSIADAEEQPPVDDVVEESAPPTYIPIGFHLPQLGFGMVTRGDNDMDLGKYAFDGTVRESLGVVVGSPLSVNVEVTSLILLLPFGPPDLVSGTNR